jgi:hypothetical protein
VAVELVAGLVCGLGIVFTADANGNLLHLDNIANLDWYYNNTLNKLTKVDKTTQYNVYDYQGNRVRFMLFLSSIWAGITG